MLFAFLRYLNFCFGCSGHAEKELDQKAKISFNLLDVTNWEANNYKLHIDQYLKKKWPSDNESWSINRT